MAAKVSPDLGLKQQVFVMHFVWHYGFCEVYMM